MGSTNCETQCILSNDKLGPTPVNRQAHTIEKLLSAASLAKGKYNEDAKNVC